MQTFADQAVIAIENARLFDEVQAKTRDLGEALEQQTATSAVLAVISRSPSDLNPVLEAISDTAARLCGSEQTMFFRYDGSSVFRILASWNFPPEVHEMLERRPLMPGHPSAIGRAGASLKPVSISDVLDDPDYGLTGEQSRARYRAIACGCRCCAKASSLVRYRSIAASPAPLPRNRLSWSQPLPTRP